MDAPSGKVENIPVKKEKEKEIERPGPRHLLTPFEEMERWAEEYFPRNWLRQRWLGWPSSARLSAPFEGRMPKVDVIDRDDAVLINAELPGVDKEDIDVSLTGNMITIKGTSRKEEKEEKGDYYRCEISRGAFSRSMPLPADVNIEKSQAKFKDGVLRLRLPKMERVKRRSLKVD